MDDNAFDPYAVLGIPATANQDQISRAYRRKLRALHPDTRGASMLADPVADEQLQRIMTAYASLRDRAQSAALNKAASPSTGRTDSSSPSGPVRIPVRYGRPRWK